MDVRNENGRLEFLNVALTVSNRILGEGTWVAIANCPTPMNSAKFVNEFKNMSKWEKTQKSVIFINLQFPRSICCNGIVDSSNYQLNLSREAWIPAAIMFSCVRITPFGGPVLPEVYITHATSRGCGGVGSIRLLVPRSTRS